MRSMIARGLIGTMFISTPLVASDLPPVYVAQTPDDPEGRQCQIDIESAKATAEAAFRYNQVSISDRDSYFKDRAIEFVIDLSGFEITREDGSATGSCVIGVDVYLGTYTKTYDPVKHDIKWATVHYCDHGYLAVSKKMGAQDTVNSQITNYVNRCVSEYEKLKSQ